MKKTRRKKTTSIIGMISMRAFLAVRGRRIMGAEPAYRASLAANPDSARSSSSFDP